MRIDEWKEPGEGNQMRYLGVNKNDKFGEPLEAIQNQCRVAGMLPFWWPIYRTLGVLGLTGWQARLMYNWIPKYEERRFTEQKCLAAIKVAKDRGMEIPVADIENKTPFSSILDPDGSKRKAWAEDFADRHSWVPVNPEIKEGDVRQQAKVLRERLQVMVQGEDTAIQADAQRCLTRLNHFMDVQMSELLRQSNAHRVEVISTFHTVTEQADSSIEAEALEKIDTASHQRIQEQYGSPKREEEINRQL